VAGKPAPKVNAVLAVAVRKSRRGKRFSVIRSSLRRFTSARVLMRLARLGGDGNDRCASFTPHRYARGRGTFTHQFWTRIVAAVANEHTRSKCHRQDHAQERISPC
jgi:hypothetical protein